MKEFSSKIKTASSKRVIDTSDMWQKQINFDKDTWDGLQVWAPIDPYTVQKRLEFRAAMQNSYVYRANWIISKLVAGQGYTTKAESIDGLPLDEWESTEKIHVPYLNKELTPVEIRKFVDKISTDMNLSEGIFNGYITSREQGRCALAMTPIDRDEQGRWQLPTSIQFIRPEYTLRPYLDHKTAEMIGVQIIGLKSTQQTILPIERCIYMLNGFNQKLFSDQYGDSQVDRITDAAKVLNIIFADDLLQVAEKSWHQPKVFGVPIRPEDYGKEDTILSDFLQANSNSKGQDIAVTQNPDGKGGVTILSGTTNSGDIAGLERIIIRCIKAVLAFYNLPAFMLSEGETGNLGGDKNTEEIDMFYNTEIAPETIKLENMVNTQYYDKVMGVLFMGEELPFKITHHFNKPKITTILRPDLYEMGKDMLLNGIIDKEGLIEMLGVEQYRGNELNKTEGADINPESDTWVKNEPTLSINWKGPTSWQNE